jgi:hypothetical protein
MDGRQVYVLVLDVTLVENARFLFPDIVRRLPDLLG